MILSAILITQLLNLGPNRPPVEALDSILKRCYALRTELPINGVWYKDGEDWTYITPKARFDFQKDGFWFGYKDLLLTMDVSIMDMTKEEPPYHISNWSQLALNDLNPVQKGWKFVVEAPSELETESEFASESDKGKRKFLPQFKFKLRPIAVAYPTFVDSESEYVFHTKSGRVSRFQLESHKLVSLGDVKVSAVEAINIAKEKELQFRAHLPLEEKVKPLNGPKSPQLVVHKPNFQHLEEYYSKLTKAGDKSLVFKFGSNSDQWTNGGVDLLKYPWYKDALCWMVLVRSDIVLVNASTGLVHYYQPVEDGNYFKIEPSGRINFL